MRSHGPAKSETRDPFSEDTVRMVKLLYLNTNGGFKRKSTFLRAWSEEENVDIVAVTETWLCPQGCQNKHLGRCQRMGCMRGWNWVGRARQERYGGGVGFLLRNTVAYCVRADLQTPEVEDFWVELVSQTQGSFSLCVVYIPPNSPAAMIKFKEKLKRVTAETRRVIVVGDSMGGQLHLVIQWTPLRDRT